jgi:hypothetical protein
MPQTVQGNHMNPGIRGGNPNPPPRRPTAARKDGLLTTWEVVEASGVSYRMLDYWIRTEPAVLGPTVGATGSGTLRLWTAEDCARVVKAAAFVRAWELVSGRNAGQGMTVGAVARFVIEAEPDDDGWVWTTNQFILVVRR